MRTRGFEPPRPFDHQPLKLVRLPIPPRSQNAHERIRTSNIRILNPASLPIGQRGRSNSGGTRTLNLRTLIPATLPNWSTEPFLQLRKWSHEPKRLSRRFFSEEKTGMSEQSPCHQRPGPRSCSCSTSRFQDQTAKIVSSPRMLRHECKKRTNVWTSRE